MFVIKKENSVKKNRNAQHANKHENLDENQIPGKMFS